MSRLDLSAPPPPAQLNAQPSVDELIALAKTNLTAACDQPLGGAAQVGVLIGAVDALVAVSAALLRDLSQLASDMRASGKPSGAFSDVSDDLLYSARAVCDSFGFGTVSGVSRADWLRARLQRANEADQLEQQLTLARDDAASLYTLDWSELNGECQRRILAYASTAQAEGTASHVQADDREHDHDASPAQSGTGVQLQATTLEAAIKALPEDASPHAFSVIGHFNGGCESLWRLASLLGQSPVRAVRSYAVDVTELAARLEALGCKAIAVAAHA